MSSASQPCYLTFTLASSAIAFASIGALIGLATYAFYTYVLHQDHNRQFRTNTKFDISSASWVLIFTSAGVVSNSASILANYLCSNCTAAQLTCNTSAGSSGAAMISALSVALAAALKMCSLVYQMYVIDIVVPKTGNIELARRSHQ